MLLQESKRYKQLKSLFIKSGWWSKLYTIEVGSRRLLNLNVDRLQSIEKFACYRQRKSSFKALLFQDSHCIAALLQSGAGETAWILLSC